MKKLLTTATAFALLAGAAQAAPVLYDFQDFNGDITEAETLYDKDQLTQDDYYFGNVVTAVQPVQENQPFPAGTWSLNGSVTVDGVHTWEYVDVDGNGKIERTEMHQFRMRKKDRAGQSE